MKSQGSKDFFNSAKEHVGQFLMNEVRDSAIREWYKILDGKMEAARGEAPRECVCVTRYNCSGGNQGIGGKSDNVQLCITYFGP